jgi:hypothetical protein
VGFIVGRDPKPERVRCRNSFCRAPATFRVAATDACQGYSIPLGGLIKFTMP